MFLDSHSEEEVLDKRDYHTNKIGSISFKRAVYFIITSLFFLSYLATFIDLATIDHRILHINGKMEFFHVDPVNKSGEEQTNSNKESYTKKSVLEVCQIQKNLMNSRALSPDTNCNQISPLDIIAYFSPSTSMEVASTSDLYLFAPKNPPPVS